MNDQCEEIIISYFNGQFKQLVNQINELTVTDFLCELESNDRISNTDKLRILIIYLRISNK